MIVTSWFVGIWRNLPSTYYFPK